ncbi:MAG: diguanylate cyclase, partial [Firmicutes bacterium]|nr:diguanylate cyclase [Bacillota bacterium]
MDHDNLSKVAFCCYFLVVLCTILFLIIPMSRPEEQILPDRCTIVDTLSWETASGVCGTTRFPATIETDGFEPVTYRMTLPDNIKDNEWICLLTHSSFELRINGEVRKEFNENTVGISGSIEKSAYLFCELTEEDAGAPVELRLQSTFAANGTMRPVYLGDAYSIVYNLLHNNLLRYAGIISLFVISLIAIVFGLFISAGRRKPANIIFFGIGILLVSLWLLTDDFIYPIVFPVTYVDGICSFLFGVLSLYPFMLYVDHLQEHRYHSFYRWLEVLSLIHFILVCIARFGLRLYLSANLLWFSLPLLFLAILWALPIVTDIFYKRIDKYRYIVWGLVLLLCFASADIILMALPIERTDGNLILMGLYIFSMSALLQQMNDSKELFQKLDKQTRHIDNVQKQNEKLALRAHTDPLTGLYNTEYLKTAVAERISKKPQGVLLLFDLDNFKYINDTFGHYEGDRVLIAFAKALKKTFRREDIVCRMGGDEFMVYMSGYANDDLVHNKRHLILDYVKNDPQMAAYYKS